MADEDIIDVTPKGVEGPGGGMDVEAMLVGSHRQAEPTRGEGNCLMHAFGGSAINAGVWARKPQVTFLRDAIAARSQNHVQLMTSNPGVWQRSKKITRRTYARPLPASADDYPGAVYYCGVVCVRLSNRSRL